MRKRRNIVLGVLVLMIACLCMTACQSSSDDEKKESVNSEQNVEDDNGKADTDKTEEDAYAMPDVDYLEDHETGLDEESEADMTDASEEEITVQEDDLTEDGEEETILDENWE